METTGQQPLPRQDERHGIVVLYLPVDLVDTAQNGDGLADGIVVVSVSEEQQKEQDLNRVSATLASIRMITNMYINLRKGV